MAEYRFFSILRAYSVDSLQRNQAISNKSEGANRRLRLGQQLDGLAFPVDCLPSCGSLDRPYANFKNEGTTLVNALLIVLIFSGLVEAHSGKLVYPIYELTDDMLEKIDIHDGFIDEWYEIGEPNMTLLDFKTNRNLIPPDPSNLDFRIWLAWHDELNRIYAAFIVIDDEYKNTHDWSGEESDTIDLNDSIVLYLDADHSGGRGFADGYPGALEEKMPIYGETQKYEAISKTVSGPTLANGHSYLQPWHTSPPYGDAGGGVAGEIPVVWVVEMYVTPQDGWGDNIDETPFSELSAHQIVGFAPVIYDFDPSGLGFPIPWNPEAIDDEEAFMCLFHSMADIFLDGLLLPAQDTAVESVTWGRIKASLE